MAIAVFWGFGFGQGELSGAGDAPVVVTHVTVYYGWFGTVNQRGAPSGKRKQVRDHMSHANVDVKYNFTPFNGTPGETYDKWERALLNAGARSDDRGYSLADHFNGNDEGSAAVPHPAAAGTADGRKSRQAQRKRQKDAYSMLTRHLHAPDHLRHIELNHFQDGRAALLYLRASCRTQVDALRLRDLNAEWDRLDIIHDIGVNENSISILARQVIGCACRRGRWCSGRCQVRR